MLNSTRPSSASVMPWLQAQQQRVLGVVQGLDDEAMRRPVLPSGWSCAGMIQHLTVGTRFWLEEVMRDKHPDEPVRDDFAVDPGRSIESVLDDYRHGIRAATAGIQATPLDTRPAWCPQEMFGEWRLDTLHDVLLHLLVETSCHAGHLDATRELLDGRTWDYPRGRLTEPS